MQTWKSKLPEIKLEERTPLVDRLVEYIEEQKKYIEILREEINRLKDHKNKPKIRPSALNSKNKKKKKNNHSKGNPNSNQAPPAKPDRFEVIEAKDIPKGSRFKGYRPYQVQELIIDSERIEYRLERWQLPDGKYVVAELPFDIQKGHFGPTLQAYVLHQHHHQGVTQPLLLNQLREWGVKISSGQLNHLLVDGKEKFHAEKAGLLSSGLKVSRYIHVDDTGARHAGRNGYCTHIGNELFAWFESTGSKSRLNFLNLLHQSHTDYHLTEHAFSYMVRKNLSPAVRKKLKDGAYFSDETSWKACLNSLGINRPRHIQIVTEAALMGSILEHGFSLETVIISDDAGQFNIFRHALCWIHIERNITKLIGEDSKKAEAVESIRGQFWNLYQRLKRYKEKPSEQAKIRIEKQFDYLCQQKTCYQLLNLQLKKMRQSKHELLLVLERPDIPLHNNLSEQDIREYVKRRKVSGSTRSEEGRRCRDTFASLKKTAIKLRVGFWDYLIDRVTAQNTIPWLPDLIIQRASQIPYHAPGL